MGATREIDKSSLTPYHWSEVVSIADLRNNDAFVFQVVVREVSDTVFIDALENRNDVRNGQRFEREKSSSVFDIIRVV
jgi:hypothetical protein